MCPHRTQGGTMALRTLSPWGVHIGAVLSSTAVGQILAGVAQVLIVRTLGVSGYGQYALLYAWLAVASALLGAGLDTWLLDSQSRQHAILGSAVRRILTIKISVWVVFGAIAAVWIPNLPAQVVAIGLIAVLIDSLSATGFQVLRAQNRHPLVASIQLIGPVVLLAGVLSGAATALLPIVMLQLAVACTTAVCVGWFVWRQVGSTRAGTLAGAVPFVISDICAQLYTQSTTILVGSMMLSSAVGVYRGAWSLVGYSFIVPAVLFQTTLPHLNAQKDPAARRLLLRRTLLLMLIYALGMGLFVVYGAPSVLPLLYGESFRPSAALLPAFAWVPFFKALSFSGVLILLMEGHIRRRIVVQVLVVTVVWATAPWLIAQGGIAGAVSAQLLSEGVLGVGYLLIAARSLRLTETPVWPPRRIVISHLHGSGNVGDAAIHQAQYALINTLFPAAHITVAAALPATVTHAFPHATVVRGIHGWVYADDGTIAPLGTRLRRAVALMCAVLLGRWGMSARWGLDDAERASLEAFRSADVVYASGGGYLYDEPAKHPWRRLLGWDLWLVADLLITRAWQRPLVLLPQSIGPCTNPPFRGVLRWILGQADRVYARDSATSTLLREWEITHHNAPDMAWHTENTAEAAVTAPRQPLLGVVALDWGAQYPSFRGQTAYEDALVATIEHYAARGWRIQLFSQCNEANPAWDDRLVTHRIAQRAACAVEVMPDIDNPTALARAYAALDCLIATRMHAAILRMRSGGTCVVIGYLPKAAALMADLGLATWHVPIAHVDAATLCALVDRRDEQIPILRQARAQIRTQQQVFVDDLRTNPAIEESK